MTKLSPPKLFYCRTSYFPTEKNDLMEMKCLFEKAVAESNLLNVGPSNEAFLRLFSLYKQATKGDISIEQLQNNCDVATKAEVDAWASLKGKSVKEAQIEFIVLVHELKN